MKLLVINGGPRKNGNTATLLDKAIEGAKAQGAETQLVNLYDLDFKGCISCFACKRKGGPSYGRCAVKDGLAPVLDAVEECDALLIGSPIYLSEVTGEVRSFLERLLFQYLIYDKTHSSLFKRKLKVGFIYTMNISEDFLDQFGYHERLGNAEQTTGRILGEAKEALYVTDTYQFDDYSKYVNTMFDPEAKAKRRREVFPEDCKKAYSYGAELVSR